MRRRLFAFRFIADRNERSLGVVFRILGIDFCLINMGYFNDWRLIDLRIPAPNGIYLQLLWVVLAVGILDDDGIYRRFQ